MNHHPSPQPNTNSHSTSFPWETLFERARTAYREPTMDERDALIHRVTLQAQERNTLQRNPSIPSPWFPWIGRGMLVGATLALVLFIGNTLGGTSNTSSGELSHKLVAYETMEDETSWEHSLIEQEDLLVVQEIDQWYSGVIEQTNS